MEDDAPGRQGATTTAAQSIHEHDMTLLLSVCTIPRCKQHYFICLVHNIAAGSCVMLPTCTHTYRARRFFHLRLFLFAWLLGGKRMALYRGVLSCHAHVCISPLSPLSPFRFVGLQWTMSCRGSLTEFFLIFFWKPQCKNTPPPSPLLSPFISPLCFALFPFLLCDLFSFRFLFNHGSDDSGDGLNEFYSDGYAQLVLSPLAAGTAPTE